MDIYTLPNVKYIASGKQSHSQGWKVARAEEVIKGSDQEVKLSK